MASIFGSASQGEYVGAFRTVKTKSGESGITFQNKGIALIQNVQVSHQQPVQNLFEVGSNKRYYVVGKSSGTFSISQILGFGSDVLAQVTNLANPCSGDRTLAIAFPNSYCRSGASAAGGTLTLTLKGVLLQSVGFTVAAQDNLINTQSQGLMTDLEYIATGA
jgi:hypothetical protein